MKLPASKASLPAAFPSPWASRLAAEAGRREHPRSVAQARLKYVDE